MYLTFPPEQQIHEIVISVTVSAIRVIVLVLAKHAMPQRPNAASKYLVRGARRNESSVFIRRERQRGDKRYQCQ